MTELANAKILLIGAGKMGGALLEAWLRSGLIPEAVSVVDPKASAPAGVKVFRSLEEVSGAFDCIVLAVKPQSMDEVLSQSRVFLSLRERLGEGQHAPIVPSAPHPGPLPEGEGIISAGSQTLILSIAAGKTLSYFAKHLGDAPVVRAMPNTPALIGQGISALVANAHVTPMQKQRAAALLAAAGEVVWLDDESQMDAVTAVSGSGPAYAFLFMEELIEAGVSQGLPRELSTKLALHTVAGSAALALQSTEPLEELRKHVTSPGGTTEAALKVLMKDDRFALLMQQAVATAVKRAGELA